MSEKKISSAVIRRLPRYYRYLSELSVSGVDRVSSSELGKQMKVTASQIRQDFNNFGGFGQQGYGYNVELLREEIGKILGLDKTYHLIIIGAGNLGQALANHQGFINRGFIVKAIFDNNKKVIGNKVGDLEVKNMEEIPIFIKNNKVDIAALTVPRASAPKVAQALEKLGVKAFWNFAATDLELSKDAIVENVHLTESLMRLSYNISNIGDF